MGGEWYDFLCIGTSLLFGLGACKRKLQTWLVILISAVCSVCWRSYRLCTGVDSLSHPLFRLDFLAALVAIAYTVYCVRVVRLTALVLSFLGIWAWCLPRKCLRTSQCVHSLFHILVVLTVWMHPFSASRA